MQATYIFLKGFGKGYGEPLSQKGFPVSYVFIISEIRNQDPREGEIDARQRTEREDEGAYLHT